MTYEELSKQVSHLGSVQLDTTSLPLLSSTNLALMELYSDRIIPKTVRMIARGVTPIVYHKQINCVNGNPFQIDITGNCYSYRIRGSCQLLTMTSGNSTLTNISTGNEAKTFKAIAAPGTTLRFFGTYTFTIYDFSVYEEMFSAEAEDVPEPGGTTTYSVRELYGDYMSFLSPAKDGSGKRIEGCTLRDGLVELSSEYNGEIVITYRRLPSLATGAEDEMLDVPDEYTHLFPLLVASYLLLDGDEALAKYYKSRYDDLLERLERGSYPVIDTAYENLNGWA